MYDYRYRFLVRGNRQRRNFFTPQDSLPTSVVFLAIHDALLIARGQRTFFFCDGLKCCVRDVISVECSECQSDGYTNKCKPSRLLVQSATALLSRRTSTSVRRNHWHSEVEG